MRSVAERLADFIVELMDAVPEAREDPEGVVVEMTREGARLALEKWVRKMGVGDVGAWRRCSCGGKQSRKGVVERTVLTLVGPVRYGRTYYWCRSCGGRSFPLDERLGWRRSQSWRVVESVVLACSQMPYRSAGELTERLAGWRLSEERMEVVTTEVGTAVEGMELTEGNESEGSQARVPERLVVEMDGTCVHTTEGWREAKVGAVMGWEVSPGGSVPEAQGVEYCGRIEEAEGFGHRIARMARRRGGEGRQRTVVLGDGAAWIWNQAELHFPGAIEIVDWYHAMEHIWEVGRGLFPEHPERTEEWVKDQEAALAEGFAMKVVIELGKQAERIRRRKGRKQKGLLDLLERNRDYFQEHRDRMRYAEYRRMGLPIGSGVVEGACKHLVGKRMKSGSMRWTLRGAHAVLELRSRQASSQWDSVVAYLKAA